MKQNNWITLIQCGNNIIRSTTHKVNIQITVVLTSSTLASALSHPLLMQSATGYRGVSSYPSMVKVAVMETFDLVRQQLCECL